MSFKSEVLKTVKEVLENTNYEIITKVSDKTGNFLVMYKQIESEKYSVIDLENNKELFDQINEMITPQQTNTVNEEGKYTLIVDFLNTIKQSHIEWHNKYHAEVMPLMPSERIKFMKENDLNKTELLLLTTQKSKFMELLENDITERYNTLVSKVENKIGKITDVSELEINDNNGIDGVIKGENGKIRLTTTLAGGYNIQRLHYRTMLKAIK